MSSVLWYEIKNFGSFGEEGGFVDLTTSSKDKHSDLWYENSGHKINLVTAIMGANGSGKTTLIKPIPYLNFLFWRIPEKNTDDFFLNYHRFTSTATCINISFLLDNKEYLYKLRASPVMIFNEELYVKNARNQNTYIFKRQISADSVREMRDFFAGHNDLEELDEDEQEKKYEKVVYDYVYKEKLFSVNARDAQRVSPNCVLISEARRLNDSLATKIAKSFRCLANVNFIGRYSQNDSSLNEIAASLIRNPERFESIKNLLRKWDLGLNDIKIMKSETINNKGESKDTYRLYGVHINDKNEEIELPFIFESAGTKNALVRLNDIMICIAYGNPCVIDELGDDLHPHMIKPILELFIDPEINTKRSQLIFTCHRPELINYLGKYRVIICEKNNNVSDCYRLDEFPSGDARASDNLAAKYLSGAFGGVPEL